MRTEVDNFFGAGNEPAEEWPETGPYLTLQSYFTGVKYGAYGPDEDCRWVSITSEGLLKETPILDPTKAPPLRTIAVAYYDK